MSHRKYLYGLAALLLAVSAVRAAPPLAIKVNPQTPATCDEPAVPSGPFTGAFNAIYTTGFEASDGWDLGFSICGFEFAACVGNVSVGNVCTPKAGVLVNGNCCDKDPNVDTGWFYNGLARHCNQPHIDNVHPASGAQHLRAQFDPAGGQPPGCTGFTSGCRQRWSSPWDRNQPEINQTTLKYDVAFSHGYIGSNTYVRQYFGNLVNGGGIFVHAYVYFDASGYVLQVDAGTGAAAPLGYWTYDSPDYAHVTVEYDPCNNIINYKYAGKPNIYYPGVCTPGTEPCGLGIAYGVCTPTGGETCLQGGDLCPDPTDTCVGASTCPGTAVCVGGGIATFSEPFSFTPPYGDYCNYSGADCIGSHADHNPAYLDSFTWSQTNRNDGEMIDIDNFSITHVNCPDACCNGDTGQCLETLSEAACAALAHGHYYPNVQCLQLGTPGFPPACGIDRGSCCDAGPGSGGSCTDGVLEADCQPPQKTWARGAACEEYSTLCAVGHGMCSSGPGLDGAPPGKAPYHCTTAPSRECVTNDDCTNPGFCYGGLCSPAAVPGHCEYSSAGFCQNMGRCSGSAACDASTGDGCCDLTCATPVTCPGTQTCEAEPQQCNAVPGGADCAFCEGCDAWPTVACSNIGQGGECPSPGIGILPGTCVANSLYVCNGDADCPEGSSGGDCVFPAVSPGGFLCTSDDQCVIPATQCGPEHLGACCHGTTGACENDVLSANCTGDQVVWTKLGVCATLDPPCVQHTGACCDASPKADCTDGIHPQACVGPNQTWFKGILCAVAQCPAVVLGACCNTLAGTCTNNETQASCGDVNPLPNTDQRVFTLDKTCANLDPQCIADLGACCDRDTFGGCTQTTNVECQGGKLHWFKLESCATVEDRGDCNHEAIPTVSQWGLVVLTLLLLVGAKVYFGRRQSAAA